MSFDKHRSTWDTYANAWKVTPTEEKKALLALSVDPGCVYRDPMATASGHEALVEQMLAFHQQIPGGWFETTYFLAHHERSIARWNMRSTEGAILGDGFSYGEYGADGRLVEMTGFFAVA